MSGRFFAGVALSLAGFALALSPVVSASASSGSPLLVASPPRAAASGGVTAGVTVYGRPWSGHP
jgi:hypothetical protein